MGWLLLGGLGIVWVVFLFPPKKPRSSTFAIEEFNRSMGLLAETERGAGTGRPDGRWIVAPRKDERFMGGEERARCRARERRRRFFVFLLEALCLSFLIGLVPPLRAMWIATGGIAAVLGLYVWMLIQAKQEDERARAERPARRAEPGEPVRQPAPARQSVLTPFGDYGKLSEDDLVHVVVYRSDELQLANA